MPTGKYYLHTTLRFPKSSADSVIRCFYYTVISLRYWRKMRFEQENFPGIGLWFAVPKDFVGIEVHEAILKEFTEKVLKGKTPFPETGTLAVIKVQPTSAWFVKKREEQEKWYLKFQLDNYADMDKLESDLREVMLELSELAFEEGQPTAQEDSVEFDLAFA